MSTYLYLECRDHEPPLRAEGESGQHLYDIRQIYEDLINREIIAMAVGLEMEPAYGHFRKNTARFLAQHPECDVRIVSEYEETYPPTFVEYVKEREEAEAASPF